MTTDWILRILFFGIVHWLLVGLLLPDLVSRKKVFGGRKAPWVLAVVLVPCFGSLAYLLFHPQIFSPRDDTGR
jgi:hypothetical protein